MLRTRKIGHENVGSIGQKKTTSETPPIFGEERHEHFVSGMYGLPGTPLFLLIAAREKL